LVAGGRRSYETEILGREGVSESQAARAHGDLTRLHRVLGDTAAVFSAVRRDPLPVRRILDTGCARGGVLLELRKRVEADLVGVELRPPAKHGLPFSIVQADAVEDRLPAADIAYSMYLGHYLSSSFHFTSCRCPGRRPPREQTADIGRRNVVGY